MEYIVGPIVAAIVSIAFSEKRCKDRCDRHMAIIEELETRVELIDKAQQQSEKEMPKRLITTLMPVAKEVTKLKSAVGI